MTGTTLSGSVFALARWFGPERYVNKPEGKFEREELLNDVYQATAVAVHEGTVLVKTPLGACMIERVEVEGAPLVTFDHVRDDRWERAKFWMNASSVESLGDVLRQVERVPFDELFVGAR